MKLDINKQRLSSFDTPTQVPANVLNLDLSHAVTSYHGSQLSMSDIPQELPIFRNGRITRFVTPKPRAVSMPARLKELPEPPQEEYDMRVLQPPTAYIEPPIMAAHSLSSHDSDSQFSLDSETVASSLSGTSLRILQFVDTYVSESSESIISKYERIIDPEVHSLSGVSTTDSLFSKEESLRGRQQLTRSEKSLPELPLAPLPQLNIRKRLPHRTLDLRSLTSAQSRTSRISSNSLQESKAEIKATVLQKPFEFCLDSPNDYGSSRFHPASLMPAKSTATGLQRPPIQPRCVTAAPDFQRSDFAAKPKVFESKKSMLLVSSTRYQEPWKRVLSSKQLPATPEERQNRFAYI